MTEFEFFFAFYGLLLGLAVAELLNGLAGVVRAGRVRSIGPRTALLAVFVLLALVATWLDAWNSLRGVRLDMAHLAAPLLIALLYYLAAVIVFPRDVEAWGSLEAYFDQRRRGLFMLLLAAELLVTVTFVGVFAEELRDDPGRFWGWSVPYNLAIKGALLGLILLKGRRVNIALLVALLALFLAPYWDRQTVANFFSGGG